MYQGCKRLLAIVAGILMARRHLNTTDDSLGQAHAVAICGVDLPLRNRTSRFRFCAVAAR
jgi:hypothetical protein